MRLPVPARPVPRGLGSVDPFSHGVKAAGCRTVGTAPYCKGSCSDCHAGETCKGPYMYDPDSGDTCVSGWKYQCCS
jgi:hypothetical protein